MFQTCVTWRFRLALLAMVGFGCLAVAAPVSAANDDAAAKKQILDSPAWREAMRGFNEWLSVQVTYDKEQAAQIKVRMKEKVNKMSAAQLRSFLEDMQKKLAILGSKEGIDARNWAEGYLTVLTTARAEAFRKQLPDVANMTAAQVQQALYDLQQRRDAQAASQKAFDQTRDQQVASIREMKRQTADAIAEADAQMSNSGGDPYPGYYGGVYAPVRYPGPIYSPVYPRYFGGWRW
jgi:hypothetical protein